MKLTKHAQERVRQRGFKDIHLYILQVLGEESSAPGGAVKISISKKRKAQIIQALDKLVGKTMILSEASGTIITAYNER